MLPHKYVYLIDKIKYIAFIRSQPYKEAQAS